MRHDVVRHDLRVSVYDLLASLAIGVPFGNVTLTMRDPTGFFTSKLNLKPEICGKRPATASYCETPFSIADQGKRHHDMLLNALEKLLDLPRSRMAVSDVLDLLEVPALRQRFGIDVRLRLPMAPDSEGVA